MLHAHNTTGKTGKSIRILTEDGKTAGFVTGDMFIKRIKLTHFLKKPPALAVDVSALDQAEAAGATRIRFICDQDGRQFATSIEHFRAAGFPLNRGFGRQWALELMNFARQAPGPANQLPLWEVKR